LHDGVLQDLCAVTRDLKALEAQSKDRTPFEALVARSGESVQTLRAICQDLRPPLLSNNPALALKALVERLDAHSPAPIHIEIAAEALNVPEETALVIHRIAALPRKLCITPFSTPMRRKSPCVSPSTLIGCA
jgi:signal transduction histidine kinase